MKKFFRRLYYRLFRTYETIEVKFVSYTDGDQMIKDSVGKPEEECWVLSKLEDGNYNYGWVYLERRKRIIE